MGKVNLIFKKSIIHDFIYARPLFRRKFVGIPNRETFRPGNESKQIQKCVSPKSYGSASLRPKNPKNGPQAKKPGCSTIFFVLPHVDIVLHFNIEIYQKIKHDFVNTILLPLICECLIWILKALNMQKRQHFLSIIVK